MGSVTGEGVPVPWPQAIAGDKATVTNWIDEMFAEVGITPVTLSKKNEGRDARTVEFDKECYRQCNVVERLSGWSTECRSVFARYEKTAINFGGMIQMAFIQRYLKMIAT
ncbi:MAG TPA: transposase [Planctomicrobium sp.]|nr:transposase [Planctomicrobium sp.]